MSEPRKNHLTIDGGQVKDDEHVASYKPIPEADTEFRTSKSNLSKSREKVSADGAEEKLLQKEDEAKIVTRVDMADAKYVVGDHRNGDAKIELDANKRQFSGLTKEELLKYADDPFWVNLRWFMFVLFWTAWLAMLAGAIAIIIRAPKCAAPIPKTWFEKDPLVDVNGLKYEHLASELPNLQKLKAGGIFIDAPTYELLDEPSKLEKYKEFFAKAQDLGIKIIVDLIPNYVSKSHIWFRKSENKTAPYTDYFVWKEGRNGKEDVPNNWVSEYNEKAWTVSEQRNEYYLHHYAADQPDLNFRNAEVREKFNQVLQLWLKAGVHGVRLNKVRDLLVDESFADEKMAAKKTGAEHLAERKFWETKMTSDQPELVPLLAEWSQLVDKSSANPGTGETVFTIKEDTSHTTELYRSKENVTSSLRPPSSAPITVDEDVERAAIHIQKLLESGRWPAMQLVTPIDEAAPELARFALLLPAAPVFTLQQIKEDNTTSANDLHSLAHLVDIRGDTSVAHGQHKVAALAARNSTELKFIACARWKSGHNGFVAIYNPTAENLHANLTSLVELPETVTVHHMSNEVKMATNYTHNYAEAVDGVLVPAHSSIVLSYVPRKAAVED
ncbi:hypothetical protein K1T71_010958 [Dendrolimus kikuchii]|uniref:Uncharacterized protein n=1 Tax=Dendrolimus kikuchii TaxID=765133 RepID=A0ACC1CQC9_9NEOP|nr:hypothetical protein K1T71_010958 [Dendrolimus kikuchii]